MRRCERTHLCATLHLVRVVGAFQEGCVCKWRLALPHLAEDHVAVDFDGRVEAGFLCGLEAVECDFDPVFTASVDAGFP